MFRGDDMKYLFLLQCFLIGISAASAVGPIFVLVFNTSALRGFIKGFFKALGAAIGDGTLFLLGMLGILSFLEQSRRYHVGIDLAGGFLLLIFGISILLPHKEEYPSQPSLTADSFILAMAKTFFYTVLNPITIFFFMFISTQMTPNHGVPSLGRILMGSAMVTCGSLSVLTAVTYIASQLGKTISMHNLRKISIINGIILLAIGGYFFIDAIKVIVS
jgi:threonine/homoserine/homoserine lactone efflux protein